jgi:ABC-type branched-subunit amino acid transport system substrate-binding protein
MRRITLVVAIVGSLLTAIPTRASLTSPMPPEATLHIVGPGTDYLTFEINLEASDPDGSITAVEICAGDGSACFASDFGPTLVDEAFACIEGDTQPVSMTHAFPDVGTYEVTATVTADSCSVLGPQHTSHVSTQLIVRPAPPPPPPPPPPDPIVCANEGEPGASDTGVFSDRIELGVAAPLTGPTYELAAAATGIQAAVKRINDAGGVCHRQLAVEIVDDQSDARQGRQVIRDFIADGKFALVAMPSANGLDAAATDIEQAQIPVIGTLGQINTQYESDWIWPIAPAPATIGTVVARHAYDLGARTFAIIWLDLLTGFEVRDSVRRAIRDLPGASVEADRRVSLSEPSYESVLNDIENQCGGQMCDALVLAIDATSAIKWSYAADRMGVRAPVATSIVPEGFNERFARECSAACDGLFAWTGFAPPVGDAPDAAITYRSDLRSFSLDADPDNALTEAAYAGTMLAAIAMGRAGVNLTRNGLRTVLDEGVFSVGLTATALSWTQDRHANRYLNAYSIVMVAGSFAGWRRETGWLTHL